MKMRIPKFTGLEMLMIGFAAYVIFILSIFLH